MGPQAHFAIGSGGVRRYAPGYCPVAGFENQRDPDFSALADLCEPGEQILCESWHGPAPPGWKIHEEANLYRMVWDAPAPANDQARDAIKLHPEHAGAACQLAALTRPGPFGLPSIALGDYYGYFDGANLVAIAGERLAADGLREICDVCTHPDFARRGLAQRLVSKLARRQLMRGERPFLHVLQESVAAHALYRRMGFRVHCVSPVRVISRQDAGGAPD